MRSGPDKKAYIGAVLLAAGAGRRMRNKVRKARLTLGGKPLFAWSFQSLMAAPEVGELVLVVHRGDLNYYADYVKRAKRTKTVRLVPGGKERQDSVGLGLKALPERWPVVLVHDSARPFLKRSLIQACGLSALKKGSGVAAVQVKDSIKLMEKNAARSLPREKLWAAQTPQAYGAPLLRQAHKKIKRICTDEMSLVEARGQASHLVEAYYENFKVTTPDDLTMAEAVLKHFRF
jgi:2-C-methyl-D-erythritol 4-phosphate cytidylyltransferase